MSVHLPLKDMTVREKLETLEALWDDLVRDESAIVSPKWHEDILIERSQRTAEDKSHFTNWDSAKAAIRDKIQ
jgi:hypothetical protein